MKPLTIVFALLLTTQFISAQSEIAYQATNEEIRLETKVVNLSSMTVVSREHSRLALQTLRSYLQQNLEYPEVMQQYLIEGTGVIEVAILKSGKLDEVRIVKSISPLFDQAILETLERLKVVFSEEQQYLGSKYIQLPVVFSIQ